MYDQLYDSLGLPSRIFGSLELSFCRNQSRHAGITGDVSFPIVIFSPGLGNSRLIYSGIAQSLASRGYAVVTVDHPYDAAIVEYPDGTYVRAANITTPDQITFDLNTRVEDVTFVVDKIHSLFGSSSSHLNFSHFLLYGHSLGGATAVATMSSDRRVVGAVNLDGSLWGQVVSHGVECPVLLFAHQGKSLATDPSWKKMWRNTAHTTKVELQLHNSTEGSFTDFPLLAETIGGGHIPDGLQGLIGQLLGTTVDEILNGYMGHFFQYCLNHASMPVLGNDNAISPHVAVLKEVVNGRCTMHCAGEL
jgi:dienelactone hydrolase